jgi:hypothetical protein
MGQASCALPPQHKLGQLLSRRKTVVASHAAEEHIRLNMVLVIKRPARRQLIRSGRVPLSTCRWHKAFHCLNSRAIGHRSREPVATTSAAQTVTNADTRGGGVRPCSGAVSSAGRRRGSTTSSGRRYAKTRQGRQRGPRDTARAPPVWEGAVCCTGTPQAQAAVAASAAAETATRGRKRLRHHAALAARCGRDSRRQEPQSRRTSAPVRRPGTIAVAGPGSAARPSVTGRAWRW